MERALYRSRQFFQSLRPRIDAEARSEALALLSVAERELFDSMMLADQQHCLAVYRRLRERDHQDRCLLTAALLHDVGKGRIAPWHRVCYVVLDAATPGLLRRLVAPGVGGGWRQALYRCLHHAQLGAERVRMAGSAEEIVALIRDAGIASTDERLLALRAADDAA